MKTFLSALSLFALVFACSKSPQTEYKQEMQDANREYKEEVRDAAEERQDEINDAKEDLREEQKEEASDYVEDSDAANIDRSGDVDVQPSEDQMEDR